MPNSRGQRIPLWSGTGDWYETSSLLMAPWFRLPFKDFTIFRRDRQSKRARAHMHVHAGQREGQREREKIF